MRYLTTIIYLVFLLLAVACTPFIKEPQVTVKSANITSIDQTGFNLDIFLAVKNQNMFDISLLGYKYELQIMALPIASGGQQQLTLFPSGKEVNIIIPARLKYIDLLEIIKRLPNPTKFPYRINATLKINSPLGNIELPVSKESSFAIPDKYFPDTYIKQLFGIIGNLP